MGGAAVSMLSADEAAAAAEKVGVSAQLARLNIFRVLLLQPNAAKAVSDLLLELLSGRALDHRLRELVIMRVGWVSASDYEWTQHWAIAQLFGCSAEDLLAVRDWETSDRFDETARSVLAATDETLRSGAISDTTLARCRALLSDAAIVELTLAIGLWRAVAQLTNGLEIPLEDGAESWPPDGLAPGGGLP
jgi:alkylhydroperoxidase family enzyme